MLVITILFITLCYITLKICHLMKETIILVLKIVAAICAAVLSVLGVSCMTSCTVSREANVSGRATIVTVDTTVINHSGHATFKPFK